MVIGSEEGRRIIMIELTVLWEDVCEEASERKVTKYQDLVHKCRDEGWKAWKAWLFLIEVGCGGFTAQSELEARRRWAGHDC